MSPIESRVRQSFDRLADRPIARSWPETDPGGNWHSPAGKPISDQFVLRRSRPAEQDGVPLTAYVSADEGLYWIHEGGGISGFDQWYGPFAIP